MMIWTRGIKIPLLSLLCLKAELFVQAQMSFLCWVSCGHEGQLQIPKFTNMRTAISGTLRGTLQQTICYWFVYEYNIPELVWL